MQQYYNNLVQASNDYYGKPEVCDSSRYSVHIRESPRSPMGNSGSGITVKSPGIQSKYRGNLYSKGLDEKG